MKFSDISAGLAVVMALPLIFGFLDELKYLPAYTAVMITLSLFSLYGGRMDKSRKLLKVLYNKDVLYTFAIVFFLVLTLGDFTGSHLVSALVSLGITIVVLTVIAKRRLGEW
ncbi:hypothetical protein [uncultured Microbulbifer sp.]|uniref:hypothetical protein n=1 Tax=uncultured Microbulbifer sp. TaxID=348147 RepID=UPI002614BEFE|nr:hypothetical protein [uncultured Microbulbifer sp.]